ncbi:hypothetical protein LXL04_002072 [Taraxacum kok-saghyz]
MWRVMIPFNLPVQKCADLRKIKEEVLLKKDPETLNEGGWCFEQSKKRQIKDTMNLVIKKRKEYEEKMKEKSEAPVMFRCVCVTPRFPKY